ncbi:hexokinase-domain-containing protein [Polychytrium aggregatum]|uniref:hexokinase-domain-containing protein n=1 Tax=Polychytrium aggregatum TaxID=110093 RepID=UPI0022FDB35D|nr:hexokinase-domain-containing protein [Polychytrium aggregatum]KAI9205602.1 hexokinase-domain-containing protein [Polychytrium aggregatum]
MSDLLHDHRFVFTAGLLVGLCGTALVQWSVAKHITTVRLTPRQLLSGGFDESASLRAVGSPTRLEFDDRSEVEIRTLERLEAAFTIPSSKLPKIVRHFVSEMKAGLTLHGQDLKMLPSHIAKRPSGKESGVYFGADLGGSGFRVCRVDLAGDATTPPRIIQKKYIVSEEIKKSNGTALFDHLADCVFNFFEENSIKDLGDMKMGFTFSFPTQQTSTDRGRLIHWTKGFTASNVEGEDVVELFQAALHRKGLNVRITALVNDCVALFVAQARIDPRTCVSIILGTGSNAAYVEQVSEISKLEGPGTEGSSNMLINMEWGNFDNEGHVLPLTDYDHILDRQSDHPKRQIFEKMISGLYLGELVRLVIVDLTLSGELFHDGITEQMKRPYSFTSSNMPRIERDYSADLADTKAVIEEYLGYNSSTMQDRRIVKRICELIGVRAARLAAAGVAGVITKINRLDECTVAIDGSLYTGYHPHFGNRMKDTLRELIGISADFINLEHLRDGSVQGSALVAAMIGQN